jgi:anti-sigma28 factor (negative regulator of flagellin synthesis)
MRIDRTNVGHVMEPKSMTNLRAVKEKGGDQEVIVSAQLQEKLQSVSQQQAAKAARIDSLREQVKSGTYQIDFDKLASKLIEDESYRR